MNKLEQIKQAIKFQKWDKDSYCYAIQHMDFYNTKVTCRQLYKKSEVITEFYRLVQIPEYYIRIKSFTTFKNIQ